MKKINVTKKTYDGEPHQKWMNGLAEQDKHNVRHLLALFAFLGIPDSYLDVGCGTGAMVRAARMLGAKSYGLDQLVEDHWGEGFYHVNLVDPFTLPNGPVQLVTCFEVGEHIHESAHATLCDTICRNMRMEANDHLIFSAARPGQGGTGHVAMRPAEYWHNEFILRGLHYDDYLTLSIAHIFSRINSPLNYLYDNLMCFTR